MPASELEKAYVAGLFDGEGSVYITLHRSKWCRRKQRMDLCCSLNLTNRRTIDYLASIFPSTIVVEPSRRSNRRTTYRWRLYSKRACDFLREIYPYMVLKKNQADVAFKFRDIQEKQRGKELTEEMWNQYLDFYNQLKELKLEGEYGG